MNFLPETHFLAKTLVNEIHDTNTTGSLANGIDVASFLRNMKEYAGADERGELINKICERIEGKLGTNCYEIGTTNAPDRMAYNAGTIMGHTIQCGCAILESNPIAATDRIFLRLGKQGIYYKICAPLIETTVGQWNIKTRRAAINKCLWAYFRNERCHYCDTIVDGGSRCQECTRTHNFEECCLCHSQFGQLTHGKLQKTNKRKKVFFHEGCKKRRTE